MSEIITSHKNQKAGITKPKKSFLRVDLTPMVDLGFLLISFFVLTTTISRQTALKLAVPDEENIKNPSLAPEGKTLNLILGSNNTTYSYNGLQLKNIQNNGSNTSALRNAILEKKLEIKRIYGSDSSMVVLIKPTPGATYKNVVDALNEMLICNIKTYVLTDADNDEVTVIKKL